MRIRFPDSVDTGPILGSLLHGAMSTSADYRRAVTRTSPLRFALTYLPHSLTMDTPDGPLISLSELHMHLAGTIARWQLPAPSRRITVAPRNSAKTMWAAEVGPLWALAHGHRRFPVLFGKSGEDATDRLANLRRELTENSLLLDDFPDLRPARGRGASDTKRTSMRGGATLAARSLESPSLGLRSGAARPDVLVLDDIQPPGAKYSAEGKRKRLELIRESVLPMNESAVVEWTGTTVMHGCLIHDAVRHRDGEAAAPTWVGEDGWMVDHFPVLLDEGLPAERSLWPDRWSQAWCAERRNRRSFALNYMCRPAASAGGSYWTPDLIVHDQHAPATDHVLSIDVAVNGRGGTGDRTALVLVGRDTRNPRRAVVEWAWAGRIRGTELRELVWQNAERNPSLHRVILEKNQGGEAWRDILSPMPPGVELVLYHAHQGKRWRIDRTLDVYERRAAVHARRLSGLEEQMLLYPDVMNDDYLDALGAGLEDVLNGAPVAA